jgi:bifunctional non-homologous end joining protein LigD
MVITHPEKILFPEEGITKGELAEYYAAVTPLMLPHIKGRPVTMERFPSGIGSKGFWQKSVATGFPGWLERIAVPKKGGVVHHPVVTDARSLQWLANQNTITMHVWTSRLPRLEQPDVCVFDLDPAADDPGAVRVAALGLRDLLDELGLPSWIKTSGSKGFHLLVPLDGKADGDDVSGFAQLVGAAFVKRAPGELTQEFSKADRKGRIYVDTGRNSHGATFAAVYTVRARPGAPVSAPVTWAEVESGKVTPQSFTLRTMAARIQKVGNAWDGMPRNGRSLTRPLAALRRMG